MWNAAREALRIRLRLQASNNGVPLSYGTTPSNIRHRTRNTVPLLHLPRISPRPITARPLFQNFLSPPPLISPIYNGTVAFRPRLHELPRRNPLRHGLIRLPFSGLRRVPPDTAS